LMFDSHCTPRPHADRSCSETRSRPPSLYLCRPAANGHLPRNWGMGPERGC
jgi:hypothetical protein